jgi:AcrR family transcriptional regulator
MILKAALAEIAEHGYEGTSIRSIARRASVDPRLVRYYFPDKQGLVSTALGECRAMRLLMATGDRRFGQVWRDCPVEWAALVGCGFASEPEVRRVFVDTLRQQVTSAATGDDEATLRALLACGDVVGAWFYTRHSANPVELSARDMLVAEVWQRADSTSQVDDDHPVL